MRRTLDQKRLDDLAIRRIVTAHEGMTTESHPNGMMAAISGGKDSCVINDLMDRAGVPHRKQHNLTTADPPECVWFVRSMKGVEIHHPKETMWELIRRNRMPPRRNARYCCKSQKEGDGGGCIVVTGIRWAESRRRTSRLVFEPCFRNKTKHYLNPIIDWTTADVWEYIRERGLPYCSLYDEGWSRVGCVLCPMITSPSMIQVMLDRWPKLCAAWERAVKDTFSPEGKAIPFRDPQAYWGWWLWDRRSPAMCDPAQLVLFDDDGMATGSTTKETPCLT